MGSRGGGGSFDLQCFSSNINLKVLGDRNRALASRFRSEFEIRELNGRGLGGVIEAAFFTPGAAVDNVRMSSFYFFIFLKELRTFWMKFRERGAAL